MNEPEIIEIRIEAVKTLKVPVQRISSQNDTLFQTTNDLLKQCEKTETWNLSVNVSTLMGIKMKMKSYCLLHKVLRRMLLFLPSISMWAETNLFLRKIRV